MTDPNACAKCANPLGVPDPFGPWRCYACGMAVSVEGLQPEGELVLDTLDLGQLEAARWKVERQKEGMQVSNRGPALQVEGAAIARNFSAIWSQDEYVDFDISVAIGFVQADNLARAGFKLRCVEDGRYSYEVHLEAGRRFGVVASAQDGPVELQTLRGFPALRTANDPVRLRARLAGDDLQVFIEGQRAFQARTSRFARGAVELAVNGNGAPLRVVFSELQFHRLR